MEAEVGTRKDRHRAERIYRLPGALRVSTETDGAKPTSRLSRRDFINRDKAVELEAKRRRRRRRPTRSLRASRNKLRQPLPE